VSKKKQEGFNQPMSPSWQRIYACTAICMLIERTHCSALLKTGL